MHFAGRRHRWKECLALLEACVARGRQAGASLLVAPNTITHVWLVQVTSKLPWPRSLGLEVSLHGTQYEISSMPSCPILFGGAPNPCGFGPESWHNRCIISDWMIVSSTFSTVGLRWITHLACLRFILHDRSPSLAPFYITGWLPWKLQLSGLRRFSTGSPSKGFSASCDEP